MRKKRRARRYWIKRTVVAIPEGGISGKVSGRLEERNVKERTVKSYACVCLRKCAGLLETLGVPFNGQQCTEAIALKLEGVWRVSPVSILPNLV